MHIDFIDLKSQYKEYKREIDREIFSVLGVSEYIMGSQISKLEIELSNFVSSKHSIVCSSGTDALILALMALDITYGDEVITTPFTFIATAEAIALVGATPVFVDIDENTYNIDVSKIENKITSKTKAIMPVSLFGQMADMDSINAIATKYGLSVIEDAAQSFGAQYKGIMSCSMSTIACTSFFPAKPLGCYGDGGAVFTNSDELAIKIRSLLNHGQTQKYIHKYIGLNARMDTIQAAVLLVKLKYYNNEIIKRQEIANNYSSLLCGVTKPFVEKHNLSVWAQYCILVEKREKMLEKCKTKGVPVAIYYPKSLHLQEVFKYLNYQEGDFPVAEKISNNILAIPMSAFLREEQQEYIIGIINE